jgi:tetratricopeptide (TPR) repeat protein
MEETFQKVKDYAAGINTLPAIQAEMEKSPEDVEVNFKMAQKYLDRYETAKAAPFFEKVLELDPDDEKGHKVEATYQIALSEARDNQNIEPLKAFIATNPPEDYMVNSYMTLASTFQRKKEPDKAIEVYEEALTKLPDNARMMYFYASTVFNSKAEDKYERALELNEKAKTLDPELELNSVYNLISYYRNLEDTENIIAAYEGAIQKWPENTGLKNSYASTINSMEIESKYDYGIELMEKAIQDDPDAAYMSYTLGLLYHKKGELEKAIAEIEKAVEKYPTRKVYTNTLEQLKKELEEKK